MKLKNVKYVKIKASSFVLTKKPIKALNGDIIPKDTVCEILKKSNKSIVIEDPAGEKAKTIPSNVKEL